MYNLAKSYDIAGKLRHDKKVIDGNNNFNGRDRFAIDLFKWLVWMD